MIRAALSALTIMVGGSSVHQVGQWVEVGGMSCYQPGNQAFYRCPPAAVAPEAATTPPRRPMHQQAPGMSGALQDAAHLLRSAAWDLDKDRKTGDDTRAESAKNKVSRALELLQQGRR